VGCVCRDGTADFDRRKQRKGHYEYVVESTCNLKVKSMNLEEKRRKKWKERK